jgi:hypothetical protein
MNQPHEAPSRRCDRLEIDGDVVSALVLLANSETVI